MAEKYFAASNSSEGFCSYYSNVFNINNFSRIYAIKGGSGTGKAFFMKEIAKRAEERSYSVRYIYCSSDSSSLDGIIIKELKIAVLDGTAPHVYEPHLVGAADSIVNLGAFLNERALAPNRAEIERLNRLKQSGFERAYRYLGAYYTISRSIEEIVIPCLNMPKICAFANRLLKRIEKGKGKEENLLVNSIGMRGVSHFDTYLENSRIYYSINDYFDSAHILLKEMYNLLKEKRVDVQISNNPIIKKRLDALRIADSSLAFEINEYAPDGARVINMKRFVYDEKLSEIKPKYRELDRARKEMLSLALKEFGDIKKHHFALEQIYGSAMDFEAKEQFTREFCNKIFEKN